MPTNNQILLSEIVTRNFADNPQYSTEDSYFEFFSAQQVLKKYDLSDEEKGWFEEAAKKAAEEERASAKETDDKLLKEMEEAGVQVNEVADKQQFRDAVKPIHEAFAADVNKELLDKINEKIAEIQ